MARPRNKRPVSVAISRSAYDGRWHGYLTVGRKPNGRPDIAHRSGATREECEDKIRQLEDELAAGKAVKTGRKPTVEVWFSSWLTDIAPYQPGGGSRRKPLAPRSLDEYWSCCKNWIFPRLGGLRLDQLGTDDLDRLYKAMYDADSSPAHVQKVHAIIRRGLAIALQRGKVARNVAQIIDNPGSTKAGKRRVVLSHEQALTVVQVIEQRDDALRWKVALSIGPRQGEVLAIRWAYVDLDEGTVDTAWQVQRRTWRHGCADRTACGSAPRPHRPAGVHKIRPCAKPNRPGAEPTCPDHTRVCPPPCPPGCEEHAAMCPDRKGGGLVFCRPKTYSDDDAAHVVSLPHSLVAELRAHKVRQAAAKLYAGSLWEDHDLVFCQPNGRPLDPRADYGRWVDILRAAGLEDAGTHVARRTAASLMLEFGEDVAVVQEVLGHSDIRTTRAYTRVSKGLTKRAATRMDEGLFGAKPTDLATERKRRRRRGRSA